MRIPFYLHHHTLTTMIRVVFPGYPIRTMLETTSGHWRVETGMFVRKLSNIGNGINPLSLV